MDSPSTPSWAEAAAQAAFPAYAVEAPNPDHVWAGGFGFGGDQTARLEVLAKVGDTEIATETRLLSHEPSQALRLRLIAHDLLRMALPFEDAALELPLHLAIEADDRTVSVGGRVVSFTGLRVARVWVGIADIDEGVELRIAVHGSVTPTSVRVVEAESLPES